MKTGWKTVAFKVITWLVVEIILNAVGLDTLADYSEFVFEQEVMVNSYQMTVVALCETQIQAIAS
jgi:hypothetical protein